jgi:hypothetical protein
MTIYKKRISLGAFAKKGEDIKDGDIITIANEGKQIEGQFGTQDIFLIKLVDGQEKNFSFNSTSMNNMIDVFGEDSKNWIGKQVKVWAILSNVQGKMIKVYYLSHPEAEITDDGEFVIPGKKKIEMKDEEIPIIEDEEIKMEDIPF